MAVNKFLINVICVVLIDANLIRDDHSENALKKKLDSDTVQNNSRDEDSNLTMALDGGYTQCFVYLSYTCLQKKTLSYLKVLNDMSEISLFKNYVKLVKLNKTLNEVKNNTDHNEINNSEELSIRIDELVNSFFDNHILKFNALGKEVTIPEPVDEFVGRKKRKGGGGGGDGGHGDGEGDFFGKKKMMMMAVMCMKMKFMMMVPAMMGMMGMMSFKGMMFSMMSFMISKMMLLMKILEKKGSSGGGGSGGDGGWALGSGGGGAWMPAGGPDYGGGGGGGSGGGGYDANGQWQSRSIVDSNTEELNLGKIENKPIISYVKPTVRYSNTVKNKTPYSLIKNLNDEVNKINEDASRGQGIAKSRNKRGVMDLLQHAYLYWLNHLLGNVNKYKTQVNYPKYRIVNGIKYVYYPNRIKIQKFKAPKALDNVNNIKNTTDNIKPGTSEDYFFANNESLSPITVPIVTAEHFNKGEIIEGPVGEDRMIRKKFHKMENTVNEAIEEDPWE